MYLLPLWAKDQLKQKLCTSVYEKFSQQQKNWWLYSLPSNKGPWNIYHINLLLSNITSNNWSNDTWDLMYHSNAGTMRDAVLKCSRLILITSDSFISHLNLSTLTGFMAVNEEARATWYEQSALVNASALSPLTRLVDALPNSYRASLLSLPYGIWK